jgi:hypothetical protein
MRERGLPGQGPAPNRPSGHFWANNGANSLDNGANSSLRRLTLNAVGLRVSSSGQASRAAQPQGGRASLTRQCRHCAV